MDKKVQKEIYDTWKELEQECLIEVHNVIPGQKLNPKPITARCILELDKYRKWVLSYCRDVLDISEVWKLEQSVEKWILCACDNSDCAKCLSVNCKDDDCYFHPKEKKDNFKSRYNK